MFAVSSLYLQCHTDMKRAAVYRRAFYLPSELLLEQMKAAPRTASNVGSTLEVLGSAETVEKSAISLICLMECRKIRVH